MKLIHCAYPFRDAGQEKDGSKEEQLREQSGRLVIFLKLVKYALNTGVRVILLLGDPICPEDMNPELEAVLKTCIEENPELEFVMLCSRELVEALSGGICEDLKNIRFLKEKEVFRPEETLVITAAGKPEELEVLSEKDVNLVVVREESGPEVWEGKQIDYLASAGGKYRERGLGERGSMVSSGFIGGRGGSRSGFVELELHEGVLKHRYVRFSPEKGVPIPEQETFRYDISLKGEFTRLVMDSDLPDDEKQMILGMGERALTGSEP